MPTIKDVAREAGVGIGTVSRVLNGRPRVATTTRQRIKEAMERLGYRPNPVAQGLRSRRTHLIEVLVPMFTRHFYVEVLRGIEIGLGTTDYGLVIRSIEKQVDRDRAFANAGAHSYADGLLIVSLAPTDELVARLQAARCPIVLVDAAYSGLSSVTIDHATAAVAAVGHLLELGHCRIALIDRQEDPFTAARPSERQAGYREALAGAGLPLYPAYEMVADFSPEAGLAALHTLLALPQPPTAIFVGSDAQAVGVLQGARQLGYRVPQDLSIVGYNDIELAPYLGLTTVRVPMGAMGQRGVELLLAQLDEPQQAPVQERLPAELVLRATTGRPAMQG
ncbi:MAG: LacI family transcriptional regulator [Chloroflexota bacterium]|nr:LacI family transcriptional regulator [Chloroflexota bacterium]